LSNETADHYPLDEVNVFEKEDWLKMIESLIDASQRMEKAVRTHVKPLNVKIKKKYKQKM
jgi:hypothetical protein